MELSSDPRPIAGQPEVTQPDAAALVAAGTAVFSKVSVFSNVSAAAPATPGTSAVHTRQELFTLAWGVFKDLLAQDTSNPPGRETAAIDLLATVLRAHGVQFTILENEPGRPNLVAEVKGSDPTRSPLLISSHVDVVPTGPVDRWSHPPFGAGEHGGEVWGRGALDMKYKTAFDLAYLIHAHQHGTPRTIRLAAVADEEVGCKNGSRFLVEKHLDLIKAEYVVNEVGGFNVRLFGTDFVPLQVGEKSFLHTSLTIPGVSAHASFGGAHSAIYALADALKAIKEKVDVHEVTPATGLFLDTLAQSLPSPANGIFAMMRNPAMADQMLANIPDPALQIQIRGMLYHTIAPTRVSGGLAVNVTPSECHVDFDCRLLPGMDPHRFVGLMSQAVPAAHRLDVHDWHPGYSLDLADPGFKALSDEVVRAHAARGRHVTPLPILMPASSDNSIYASAGIKPLGFAPLWFPPGFPGFALVHAVDERLPKSAFEIGIENYFDVMDAMCGRP